jgi:hypothetical protein
MWFSLHLGGVTRMQVMIKKPGERFMPLRVGISAL